MPNLRLQIVLGKQLECLIMNSPKRKVFNAVAFVLQDLRFECRHMLRAPVVGNAFQSESIAHLSTLGG